jgi:hypothetical protein
MVVQAEASASAVDDAVQSSTCSEVLQLQNQLKHAKIRLRELEHECRVNGTVADELVVLQQQLELTMQQSSEWQRRHAYDQNMNHCIAL